MFYFYIEQSNLVFNFPTLSQLQQMQNQQPTICLKIFHRLYPPYTSTLPLTNRTISQNLITKEINKFIGLHQMENFYDIEIRSQGNWVNIIDVFGSQKDNQFKVGNINGQLTIQIRLVEQAESMQEEKKVRGMFKEWENRIKGIEGKSETIYRRIKEDARNIEEDYEIDLAIFYSEPLMNKNEFKEYERESVSFQTQTRTIFQKLNKQLRQSNTIKHSANIVLEVGTRESIRKALSRGVKMLHFSCHGNLKELEIQSTDKIGICDDLTCQEIIAILKDYKLPEIIVFNACCSNQIAKLIYNEFLNENKFVATFGFEGLVENQVCTQFATNFYSQIFKGNPIKDSLNTALTQKVRLQLKSFFSQSQKITIKSTNIEQTKRLQIKNRLCNIPMRIQFPKQPLYIFLNYIHNNKKKIINLNGPMQIGKTLIAKKALFYLHQRNRIDQFEIVDLKEKGYQVCNVLDFRKEIKRTLIANSVDADKMLFVAIDHCDSLLKYQLHLFNKAIKQIQVQQEPANRKILLISRTKVDEADYQIDFHSLDQSYKKRWCKKSSLNIMQQVRKRRAQKSQTFVKSCYCYIFSSIKKLGKKFLLELPFISLFPDQYYPSTVHSKKYESPLIKEQQLQKQCHDIINDIENYSRSLTYCQEQITQFQDQVRYWNDIVKEIYLIVAIQMLIVHFIDKFETAKFQDVFRILNRILNVCVIDQQIFMDKSIFAQLKESIKLIKIKVIFLHFHIQKTWFVDEPYLSQISLSAIQESTFNNYFGIQSRQFQEIYDFSKSLYNMSNQNIKNEQNQQTNFQDIKNAGYLEIITHMSLNISQPNPKTQLKLYTYQQIDHLLLPLLPIIQRQIMSINKTKNENKMYEIQILIQKYNQIFNKDSIFSNVYLNYQQTYVHVLYEREKYRLWHQRVDRFEVIGKFNCWVQLCQKKNYAYLREEIDNFKKNNFDYFVTFVSFPANKTYRLEMNIAKIMLQTYQKLNKQVYLKLQTLSQDNLQRYQKLQIKLPIVLYMVDVKHEIWSQIRQNQNKHNIYLCLQNNSPGYDKDVRYIQVKKVNFLQSTVSIICGNMSHKIRNDKLNRRSSVIIRIDTQKIHTNRNQKNKSQIINEGIQQVSHGLIIKQLIMEFYQYFCKFMFCNSQCYHNQYQQIQRSFLNAKLIAKIKCAVKYGGFYHVINYLSDQISIQYTNDELIKMPPFQLNPSTQASNNDYHRIGNECKLKKHKQKPRNFYLDNIDTGSEIGYKQQSIQLTKIIMTYFLDPIHKSNFLILVCKYHEEDTLINNIYGRLRRSQLFKIKFVRPNNKTNKMEERGRERLNSMDSVSMIGQAVEGEIKQGRGGSTLFIVDLTGQQIESAQQKIQQRVYQQQRQVPQLTIFILNASPIFIQNENLKRIQKIMINKIENKNIIPLIIRKKMLLKMQKKDYSLKWTQQLISKMDKYLPLSKIQSIHSYDQDKNKSKINQRNQLEQNLEDLLK